MSDKKDSGKLPKMNIDQARHGGGTCEFSLSYDGGKSFHVIATYTKTCPDAGYEWPVKIPKNAPSCHDPDTGKKKSRGTAMSVNESARCEEL